MSEVVVTLSIIDTVWVGAMVCACVALFYGCVEGLVAAIDRNTAAMTRRK